MDFSRGPCCGNKTTMQCRSTATLGVRVIGRHYPVNYGQEEPEGHCLSFDQG